MSSPADALDTVTGALASVRVPVDALLTAYLDDAVATLAALDPALGPVAQAAAALVASGGKRLRPAFVYWGARAAGVEKSPEQLARVYTAGAAVELLHTFALIHDDVMDRAASRRGQPTLQHALAAAHQRDGLAGDAEWFGIGGAILAGDVVFVWADELFDRALAGTHGVARAREVFTQLRLEVMAGQYLDLRLAGQAQPSVDDALKVALLKSGRYTVTRPLLLGAALAAEPAPAVHAALEAYGDALGVAFQLRDDVLGLYGDPAETGKETLSDLREGKRTLLILRALEHADAGQQQEILRALGDEALEEDGAQRVRDIVEACGALETVEAELAQRLAQALDALADVPEPARSALAELAQQAAHRHT